MVNIFFSENQIVNIKSIVSKRQLEFKDFFNKIAEQYNKERVSGDGRIFNELIEMPATKDLVGKINSDDFILDIGTGIGAYAEFFGKENPLVFLKAIDVSEKMLEIAVNKCRRYPNISFEEIPFEKFESDIKFDVIVGGFMLGYFDDLPSFFNKVENLLNDKGVAVFSMLHPVRLSSINRTLFSYEVSNYFEEKTYNTDLSLNQGELILNKWNINDIFEGIKHTELVITDVREPIPINTKSKKYSKQALNFFRSNPSVIVFKFEKRCN